MLNFILSAQVIVGRGSLIVEVNHLLGSMSVPGPGLVLQDHRASPGRQEKRRSLASSPSRLVWSVG